MWIILFQVSDFLWPNNPGVRVNISSLKIIHSAIKMLSFKKSKVITKLTMGFLVVSCIGAFIGINGVLKAGEINDLATQMYEKELLGLSQISEANVQLIAAGRAIRNAVLANDDESRNRHTDAVLQRLQLLKEALNNSRRLFAEGDGKEKLKSIDETLVIYEKGLLQTIERIKSEHLSESRESIDLINRFRVESDKIDSLMTEVVNIKKKNASWLNDETDRIYEKIRLMLTLLTISGVIVGVAIGVIITISITRQLGGEPADVAHIAENISRGDLTSRIDMSRARPGSVITAMQEMQVSLQRVVGTVRSSSDSIATGATQIDAGNANLSSRTEEQASNLEETAASMEELASTVKSNSDAAITATMLAQSARDAAAHGGGMARQMVDVMNEINTSSKKIEDIINVIDSIAFQTNILALNAAVEAARAGEQGRGFAVVAAEVRSLAVKSAEAAKEIKSLIEDSVSKVGNGHQLAQAAGSSIEDIVTQVQKVSSMIEEISGATREQSQGIDQINDAIIQLDQVTQQNAALVEESAAAAGSLSQQAQALVSAVSIFKLDPAEKEAPVLRKIPSPMRPLSLSAS